MPRWITHTKSGQSFTDKTHYPWDIPADQITSVERITGGKSVAILKSDEVHHFFPKTEASVDFVMMGEHLGARPVQLDWEIIGCHIGGELRKDGTAEPCYRIELFTSPVSGNMRLKITRVKEPTKDGF